MKALPTTTFFKIADTLMPVAYPHRAGGMRRRVVSDEDLYRVEWKNGDTFTFIHPGRYRRYAWPDGLHHALNMMREKYQHADVRVLPGDIVIEAGANVGEFTVALAGTAAAIHAFEPDPRALRALRRNTAAYANIKVHGEGLGDKVGTSQFFISSEDADSSLVKPDHYTDVQVIQVTTVAQVMEDHGLKRVGFLKVEAEGFEPEILRGCGDRLVDVERIAVDCSPEREGQAPTDEIRPLLEQAGFATWLRPSKGEIPDMLFALNRRFA